jgi:hypothetical protein
VVYDGGYHEMLPVEEVLNKFKPDPDVQVAPAAVPVATPVEGDTFANRGVIVVQGIPIENGASEE